MKDKKRIFRTIGWVIVVVLWFGIYKISKYQIAMYFSNLAPKQLEDDNAYSLAKIQPTVNTIASIIFIVILAILIWRIIRNLLILSKLPEKDIEK